MPYITDSLKALAMTMRSAFRKPTTVEYPKVERPRPERTRLSFALVHDEHGDEACIACLQCERICPSEVITIKAGPKRVSENTGKKRGYLDDFTLDLNACIYCELCVQVCPVDAILMTRVHQRPVFAREDLVLTMERLYENEKTALAWATAAKLHEMQDPKRGETPPTPKPKAEGEPAAKPGAKTEPDAKEPAGD